MAGSYFSTDTIAAIATSQAGDGGVGIVRISGSAALDVAAKVVRGFVDPAPRLMRRIEVIDPSSGDVLDDGLGVYFPEGYSFTGEEVVELQVHGGRFLLQRILQLVLSTGNARLALPGEFSFRAVRNGKLSLSGAQGIAQLVAARSMFEVRAARKSLSKARYEEFKQLADRVLNLLAQSELSIDFIDQDVEVISEQGLKSELAELSTLVRRLLDRVQAAQRIARGLQVTLVGEPNAGKSTLFNALLAEDRSIVSPEAGTTRDVITEEIRIGPYYVRLADTAGIREFAGNLELEGIGRAKELLESSDVAILVVDATCDDDGLKRAMSRMEHRSGSLIVVLNKVDLVKDEALRSYKVATLKSMGAFSVHESNAVSSEGVLELLRSVESALDSKVSIGLDSSLPTEFQLQMLLECSTSLAEAFVLVTDVGLAHPELLSAALKNAANALSDLVGETTPDTVLAKIFSEFCIGK